MERMVTVSLQPSVLKAAVLSYDELFAGQVLPGTVLLWKPVLFLCVRACVDLSNPVLCVENGRFQPLLSTVFWSLWAKAFGAL
jgi:hypothetical protein